MKDKLIFLVPVISFILGYFAPILKAKVKKTDTKIDDFLLEIALASVGFVDKAFKEDKGESKKQRAKDIIESELNSYNKKVSDKILDKVIEKAVTINKIQEYNEKGEELVPLK